jgi:hypothetical protein
VGAAALAAQLAYKLCIVPAKAGSQAYGLDPDFAGVTTLGETRSPDEQR